MAGRINVERPEFNLRDKLINSPYWFLQLKSGAISPTFKTFIIIIFEFKNNIIWTKSIK